MPAVDGGAELHLGALAGSISAELRFTGWLPQKVASTDVAGAGAEFWAVEAAPMLCWRWKPGSVHLDSCAGARVLTMLGEGFGVSRPGDATARWASAAIEFGALLPLADSFGMRSAANAFRPFSRPKFALQLVEHDDQLHRAAQFGLGGSLALELLY
jgi:hypothetical protein